MTAFRLLLALVLLAPCVANAQRLFSLEAAGALVLRDDPQGSLYEDELAFGARASFAVHPLLDLPEELQLGAGLLWYGSSTTEGTRAVQVQRGLHTFALPLHVGWTLGWRPLDLRLAPYLTAGPAATWIGVDYQVFDPVAVRNGLGTQHESASKLEPGAVYGAGLGIGWGEGGFGLAARLEALRLRRGPNDDLALGLGLGATF